jgi:hypothetical protein
MGGNVFAWSQVYYWKIGIRCYIAVNISKGMVCHCITIMSVEEFHSQKASSCDERKDSKERNPAIVTFFCRGINASRNDLDTFYASYMDLLENRKWWLSHVHRVLLKESGMEEAKRLCSQSLFWNAVRLCARAAGILVIHEIHYPVKLSHCLAENLSHRFFVVRFGILLMLASLDNGVGGT